MPSIRTLEWNDRRRGMTERMRRSIVELERDREDQELSEIRESSPDLASRAFYLRYFKIASPRNPFGISRNR